MKTKENIVSIISILLLLLWIYTSTSKLLDVGLFKSQLSRQAMIGSYTGFFVWFIPIIEIIAALLLMFTITRKTGMILSFWLMVAFTGYIGLVAFGFIKKASCSCGGVLAQMGFKEHFWFNLFFASIAGLGWFLLVHNKKSNPWKFLTNQKTLFRPSTAEE